MGVALFHFNEVRPRGASFYDAANRWGWLGVTVFFVLSGYCVQRATERERTPRDFFLRRFARIYPGYLFSLVAVVAFCLTRKLTAGTNDFIAVPTTLAAWAATLTLTTAPVTSVPTINWVNWSLSFEIFFYAVLVVGLVWPRARLAWLIALCGAAWFPLLEDHVFFLRSWGPFALGVALALGRRELPWLATAALAATIHNQTTVEVIVAASTAAIIVSSGWIERTGGLVLTLLARLGAVSYSLYLIHVPVGVWLVSRYVDAHGWRTLGLAAHLACDAASLAASILAAAVISRWIEQPGIAWGRRITASK